MQGYYILKQSLFFYLYVQPKMTLKKGVVDAQVVYIVIGAGLYLVFQDDTKSDVLLKFSAGALGPLIGARVAGALTYVVWLGFAFNLIVRCPATLHAANHTIRSSFGGTAAHCIWRRTVLGWHRPEAVHERNAWMPVQVTYPMIHWGLREVRPATSAC